MVQFLWFCFHGKNICVEEYFIVPLVEPGIYDYYPVPIPSLSLPLFTLPILVQYLAKLSLPYIPYQVLPGFLPLLVLLRPCHSIVCIAFFSRCMVDDIIYPIMTGSLASSSSNWILLRSGKGYYKTLNSLVILTLLSSSSTFFNMYCNLSCPQ